jgi:hypothetical protein
VFSDYKRFLTGGRIIKPESSQLTIEN